MERIVKVGKFFCDVTYGFENEIPKLESIYAFTGLILFESGTPVIFECADYIKLADAECLTLDRAGEFTLASALTEAIKTPKSNPVMAAI